MPHAPDPRRTPPRAAVVLRAALEYFGIVFALAFLLGVLRTLVLATLWARSSPCWWKLPVVLAIAWSPRAARCAAGRWHAGGAHALLAMGALAFVLLMLAEAALTLAFGGTLAGWWESFATPAGATGLAGQAAYALIRFCAGAEATGFFLGQIPRGVNWPQGQEGGWPPSPGPDQASGWARSTRRAKKVAPTGAASSLKSKAG